MKKKLVFDIELYSNYALFSFSNMDCSKYIELEMYDGQSLDKIKLRKILSNYTIITFNGDNFDIPIVFAALKGADNKRLKTICDHIIKTGDPGWATIRHFGIRQIKIDHIDIKEPSPGVAVSLKLYGGRLGAPKLQDLPIEPDSLIQPEQRLPLRKYCRNDLHTTRDLYKAVEHEITLREEMSKEYGVDLRSKSGAQVAKAVFGKLLGDMDVNVHTPKVKEGTVYKYVMPKWITFKTDKMKDVKQLVVESDFIVNDKGSVLIPKELQKVIEFDGAKYKIGIGGLHSQEKKQAVVPANNQLLFEKDVGSMYPNIIVGQNLYPKHLGKQFISLYANMIIERLTAKANGNKPVSNSLKLVLNSSFGLFGNRYSFLYSPDLLIQTTITGQLCLLMLIERLAEIDVKVVSANTDGVNVLCYKDQYEDVEQVCFQWELETGLNLEENPYAATYNESVNSYIAVERSGGVKSKGNYATTGLMKNPNSPICSQAVIEHLVDDVDIEGTILNETDITKFLTVRTVNGGSVFKGEYLGRVVRFYHSTDGDSIHYKKNGNKVPKSDGCKPMMDLNDTIPGDLDYNWYINESYKMLGLLGVKQ